MLRALPREDSEQLIRQVGVALEYSVANPAALIQTRLPQHMFKWLKNEGWTLKPKPGGQRGHDWAVDLTTGEPCAVKRIDPMVFDAVSEAAVNNSLRILRELRLLAHFTASCGSCACWPTSPHPAGAAPAGPLHRILRELRLLAHFTASCGSCACWPTSPHPAGAAPAGTLHRILRELRLLAHFTGEPHIVGRGGAAPPRRAP
eukprot:gene26464-37834_t